MKLDAPLALRLGIALFLFTGMVGLVYLIGAAQNFYEETLESLFRLLQWLSWTGALLCCFILIPWLVRSGGRWGVAGLLGLLFLGLFTLVVLWGVWVYPGGLPQW